MKSKELADIYNLSSQAILKRTKKAMEKGKRHIELDGKFYRFEMVKGHYIYQQIEKIHFTAKEIAEITGLAYRTIKERTLKAKNKGFNSLKIFNRYFQFEMVDGRYIYEEIHEKIIDTADTPLTHLWRKASEEKKKLAIKRLALVRDYRNRPDKETWKRFLERVEYKYRDIKPTRSKLFRWLEIVRRCEENGDVALEHLLDTRGQSSNNRSYTDEHYAFIERLFLENPDRSKRKIHEYLEEEFGKGALSYATVSRLVDKYKRENILVATLARSPKEANNKLRPAPGSASEVAPYNNALWELDATPVDVMCADGVRYTISGAIDVFSRRPVCIVVPTSNANAVARVFKKAIQKLGVPEKVRLDNGKEYRSASFEYTCARLGIEQQFTEPYSGWQKPHIERFFGTLTRDLFEELPGYIGHNVAERARIQDRETYEAKLAARERAKALLRHGNAAAKRLARKQMQEDAYIPTTLSREELEAYIDRWIEHRYEKRVHRGINESPIERWHSCAVPVRRIEDERLLDVLVGLSEKKRITKRGVTWKKISYWNDIFYDRVGESVWMLSDDDLGYIYVYDLEMKFLCRAESAEHIGKSRAEYMASRFFDKKSKRIIRELEELRRESPHRWRSLVAQQAEAAHHEPETPEVALAMQSEAISRVAEGVNAEAETEETAEVFINGRPIFHSLVERFLWDLEHDRVDEDTQRLAAKNERVWQLAKEEWENKRAG